jgi:alanine-synthesizing transaminase
MSDISLSSRLGHDHATPNDFAREVSELRGSGTPLWDLTVTNPTRARLPRDWRPIHDALVAAATDNYAPEGLGHLVARRQIASHLNRVAGDEHGFFDAGSGQGYAAERLMLTASTSDSYAYLFKALCNPGDCILVPEPSYPLLSHLAALEGLRAVPYRLNYDGAWYVDWESVNDGLRELPKAVGLHSRTTVPTLWCSCSTG